VFIIESMANQNEIKVLLIEDNPGDARLISEYLKLNENYSFIIQWVSTLNNLKETVSQLPHLILLDLNFPESRGIDTFDLVHSIFQDIPIIVQTGLNDEQIGQASMARGAQDYLVKGNFDGSLLSKSIIYSIERDNLVKRLQQERLSHEREKIVTEIFENASVAIYRSDREGNFLIANTALAHLFGYNSLNEIRNVNAYNLFPDPALREKFLNLLEEKKAIFGYEHKLKKKDNSIITVLESCRLTTGSSGNYFYEGVLEDISFKKEAEEKILKFNEDLLNLNKTKDKLFSIIAHDLKSPFQLIHSYSEILNNEIADMSLEEVKKSFSYILDNSRNTLVLLENLLDWAKLQTNRRTFELKNFDISKVIKKAYDLYYYMAINKNIKFSYDCPENTLVTSDENIIYTVFRNLISNSLKFTNRSGNVTISTFYGDSSIKVNVSDNGIGMTSEQYKNISGAHTLDSSKGTMGEHGTGLGLVLCKELLQKLSIELIIDSKLGKGTNVSFSIPVFQQELV
jgi:PAS domain S-box-containing protein